MKRNLTELEKQSTDVDQAKQLIDIAVRLQKLPKTAHSREALLTDAENILLTLDSSYHDKWYFATLVMVNITLARYYFNKHLENKTSEKDMDALNSASMYIENALKNMESFKTLHEKTQVDATSSLQNMNWKETPTNIQSLKTLFTTMNEDTDVGVQKIIHTFEQKISATKEKISQALRDSATQTTPSVHASESSRVYERKTEEHTEEVQAETEDYVEIAVPTEIVEYPTFALAIHQFVKNTLELDQKEKNEETLKQTLAQLKEVFKELKSLLEEQPFNRDCLSALFIIKLDVLQVKNQLAELLLNGQLQTAQNKISKEDSKRIKKAIKYTQSVLEDITVLGKSRLNQDNGVQKNVSAFADTLNQIEKKSLLLKSGACISLSEYYAEKTIAFNEEGKKTLSQLYGNTAFPPSAAPTSTAPTESNTTSIYSSGVTSFAAPSSTASTSTTQDQDAQKENMFCVVM